MKILRTICLFFVFPALLLAQQGVVIIRSGSENVQASVSAAGVSGTNALAIQGVTGGVSIPVTASLPSNSVVHVTPIITGYVTDFLQGMTTIASGSTSTITSTTTFLQSARCNNVTASAVTVTIMNGAGAYLVGPNFSIPANSNVEFLPGSFGTLMTSGVTASAGAAASAVCSFGGKQ